MSCATRGALPIANHKRYSFSSESIPLEPASVKPSVGIRSKSTAFFKVPTTSDKTLREEFLVACARLEDWSDPTETNLGGPWSSVVPGMNLIMRQDPVVRQQSRY